MNRIQYAARPGTVPPTLKHRCCRPLFLRISGLLALFPERLTRPPVLVALAWFALLFLLPKVYTGRFFVATPLNSISGLF
jgi:hypothetical protein